MRYLIIAIVFLTLNSFAQKWDNTYGTTYYDESFEDIEECYDRGYMISGTYQFANWANWIFKTNINGDILWERKIFHNDFDLIPGEIDQNSSGEVAIAQCVAIDENTWPSVIKLDSCGNQVWCRVFIDNDYAYGGCMHDAIIYSNGDVLALGRLEGVGNDIDQIFLYYVNSNGSLLWRNSYASLTNHPLVKPRIGYVLKDFGDEYIIAGRCYYPYPGNPNTGYKRPFFIGIDSLFNEKWILPFGLNDSIIGKASNVIALSDSVFMGVGYRITTTGEYISLLTFFNSEGNELGYTQIPNEAIGSNIDDNISTSIARINDTLFIATVFIGSEEIGNPFGEMIVDTSGNIYKFEIRPNTKGVSVLTKTFDNKYTIGCDYEQSNENRDIYLYKINDSLQMDTVYPGTYTYDSLCPYQIESGTIDITDCILVTDVGKTPGPKEYFESLNTIQIKAYPNPTKDGEVTLAYQNTQLHRRMELKCFNVLGEQVHEEIVYKYQVESKVNIHNWQSGIYVALVYSNSQLVGQTKFIVQ